MAGQSLQTYRQDQLIPEQSLGTVFVRTLVHTCAYIHMNMHILNQFLFPPWSDGSL